MGNKDQAAKANIFLTEAAKVGTTKALMSDVVGMPDAEDEEFIQRLITIHEKITGGLLAHTLRESRKEFDAGAKGSLRNDSALVNKESNMTYDFEFPASFIMLIEKYYPTMFRDVKHYRWFKRKLPNLMIRPNSRKG